MKSFNWLHLTDLHFGQPGQSSLWPNIREVFWEDLAKLHEKSGPWQAVLFTGDFVYGGTADEFNALEDKVLGPLWEHLAKLGSKDPVLLAVPGNHDLVRPDIKKQNAAMRQMLRKDGYPEIAEEFCRESECEYRELITASFANYQKWSDKNTRNKGLKITPGILPGDFAASLEIQSDDGKPLNIGIAGINTTFLQLVKGDFKTRLIFDSKQLYQACGNDLPSWAKAHDACILMTHQGPEWFDENTATNVYREVNPAGRFAVHLFGHMHETTLRSTSTGGGKVVRQWQGNSLFGLEKFGEPPQTDRRHGYGAGRIEFADGGTTIRHWPRRAIKDANGWRFSPDHDSCVLVEGDSCTEPERLEDRSVKPKYVEGVGSGTQNEVESQGAKPDLHEKHVQEMELKFKHALEAFKGQPSVFLEPKISKTREFNEEPNKLHALMDEPCDTLITAPAEFGLTCLGLHMQLEAYKKHNFWLYIDSEKTKARKISDHIDECILHYSQNEADLKCIIIDSWKVDNIDHLAMVKNIVTKCPGIPMIILAEDSLVSDFTGNLAKLNRNFDLLHLQALSRNSMRKLVAGFNEAKSIGTEDVILSSLAGHFESINIHRTPLNCYTLLRVLDSSYNEKLLNKSKLLKAILFVLFTDHGSFSFLSNKPEVDECTFVLGCFCKELVKEGTRHFELAKFSPRLREICQAHGMPLDVDAMIEVLLDNNIIVKHGKEMAFRHRYWIFYFAAEWMRHDDEFRQFIFKDRNYINYTEIIEFYTGIDGKRSDAIEVILSDLKLLIDQVDKKIGIERDFDPLSPLLWSPNEAYIQEAMSQIAEKVDSSNLPPEIKDKQADGQYHSVAPYDQSIRSFLKDFSVLSLLNSIKAASCALRSSQFVDIELRHTATTTILQAWEEISRVVFWITPLLAKEGVAIHDGFALRLADGFSQNFEQRYKEVIVSNPSNIVRMLGVDLASKKIGPLLAECFHRTDSMLQKHMLALFVVTVRPTGWADTTLSYINLLHPRSFYLGNMFNKLTSEVTMGDLEPGDEIALKRLTRAIVSKREYAPKVSVDKEIPRNKLFNEENKLPLDQLLKGNQRNMPSP